jgi:hypothetical protein
MSTKKSIRMSTADYLREEGRAEGRAEGKAEVKFEVENKICNAFVKYINIEFIADVFSITEGELKAILLKRALL